MRWISTFLISLMIVGTCLSATGNNAAPEKLLPQHNLLLPWLVGIGIFVCTLIAGLKHPGRTHLD